MIAMWVGIVIFAIVGLNTKTTDYITSGTGFRSDDENVAITSDYGPLFVRLTSISLITCAAIYTLRGKKPEQGVQG